MDIVVPACQYKGSLHSPNGGFIYIQEEKAGLASSYMLDLKSSEKVPYAIYKGSNHFITDDLLYVLLDYGLGHEGGEYILDWKSEIQ